MNDSESSTSEWNSVQLNRLGLNVQKSLCVQMIKRKTEEEVYREVRITEQVLEKLRIPHSPSIPWFKYSSKRRECLFNQCLLISLHFPNDLVHYVISFENERAFKGQKYVTRETEHSTYS